MDAKPPLGMSGYSFGCRTEACRESNKVGDSVSDSIAHAPGRRALGYAADTSAALAVPLLPDPWNHSAGGEWPAELVGPLADRTAAFGLRLVGGGARLRVVRLAHRGGSDAEVSGVATAYMGLLRWC